MSQEHRQALPTGTRLHEYELLSVLGSGGFGVVYLAHDHELGQQVVIKEYLPLTFATRVAGNTVVPVSTREAGNFRWGLDSFISEARTLAEFRQCPNVVSVLRYFKANNTGYMVMEYAGAVSLQDFLEVHQTLTEKQLLALVLPLLDALETIHAKGVIHRDIKPGNILINDDSQPVLIDFGAARQAIGERTMSLTTLLTPEYAPFEQHHKAGQQGPWTDIYALAAVMFRCVTGTEPPTSAARMDASDDPLVLAGRVKGDYAPYVLAAIEWGLRLRAADRPQHVEVWRQRLTGADADVQPVLAGPVTERPGLDRLVAKVRQSPALFHKKWVAASLLGGLLLTGMALVLATSAGDSHPPQSLAVMQPPPPAVTAQKTVPPVVKAEEPPLPTALAQVNPDSTEPEPGQLEPGAGESEPEAGEPETEDPVPTEETPELPLDVDPLAAPPKPSAKQPDPPKMHKKVEAIKNKKNKGKTQAKKSKKKLDAEQKELKRRQEQAAAAAKRAGAARKRKAQQCQQDSRNPLFEGWCR